MNTRRMGLRAVSVLAFGMIGVAAYAMQPAGGAPGAGGQPGQPGDGPARRGPGGPGGDMRQASVDSGMKGMNRAFKQLEGMVGDKSKKADALKLINAMQVSCVSAKGADPDMVKKAKSEEEKAETSKKFRTSMLALTRKLLDLEEHVLNDQADAAKSDLDAVVKLRDEGHKTFNVKE